jgi:tRNA pseudouridine38-40 synthase
MAAGAPSTRIALLVAYDGTAYRGWQVQRDPATVQGLLAEALRPLLGKAVRLTGASRTDAGVHALGQVATFESPRPLGPEVVRAALNATLPRDIRVLRAATVPEGFDARRSARLKRYGYLIDTAPVGSPFLRRYAWHLGRAVDCAAMRTALGAVRGTHDFSAFCAAAGRDRRPTRTVRAVRVVRRGSLVGLVVSADSFLHHMVRNLVGTAVEVGLGRRSTTALVDALATRDRRRAGPTAPAHGLYLLSVRYPWQLFPGGGRGPRLAVRPRL